MMRPAETLVRTKQQKVDGEKIDYLQNQKDQETKAAKEVCFPNTRVKKITGRR